MFQCFVGSLDSRFKIVPVWWFWCNTRHNGNSTFLESFFRDNMRALSPMILLRNMQYETAPHNQLPCLEVEPRAEWTICWWLLCHWVLSLISWYVLTWICYCILILYNTCWTTKFDGKQVHATNFPPFTINFSGHLISSATTVPLVLAFLLQNKWFDSFIAVCFFLGSIPKRQALGIQETDAVCEGTDSWFRLSKRSLVRNGHIELSIGFLLILYGFLWIPYCRFIYL